MSFKLICSAFALLTGLGAFAQIEVEEYEIQIFHNIDNLDEIASVQASSSCGEVETTISEQMFSGGCLGNLVRTYKFTDGCGNTATAEQYIVLQDDLAPTFVEVPKDIDVVKNSVPKATELQVEDNSEEKVEIEFSEELTDVALIRTWIARDRCGNEAIAKQVLTFQTEVSSAD